MKLFKSADLIRKSKYISRDLSWLRFNYRVLDQAQDAGKSLFDRLKFLAITSSNTAAAGGFAGLLMTGVQPPYNGGLINYNRNFYGAPGMYLSSGVTTGLIDIFLNW